jgi:hypothetical protein
METSKKVSTKKAPSSLRRESALPLEQRIQNLVDEMRVCIQTKQQIDLSTPPHREITEALHQLVYEEGNAAELPIRYTDSAPKKPFPIRTLWLPDTGLMWPPHRALALGTLTFRHVNYDDYVDRYLIRDRETRSLTSAGIEELAYERMTDILKDPVLEDETFLAIYQTGLEPLTVGLYRALVEHLQHRRQAGLEQMVVQPILFVDDSGRLTLGKLWR